MPTRHRLLPLTEKRIDIRWRDRDTLGHVLMDGDAEDAVKAA